MATAKEIGIGIKNARLTVGITQAELARRLGVTPQAISQYERGIKKPKIETIEKIADALGVSWLHLSHLEDLATASRERELYQKDKVRDAARPAIVKLLAAVYGKCDYTSIYQLYNGYHVYGTYYALDTLDEGKRALDQYAMEQIIDRVVLALSESVNKYVNTETTLQGRILGEIEENIEELSSEDPKSLDFLPDIEKVYQSTAFDCEIPTSELNFDPAGDDSEENTPAEKA